MLETHFFCRNSWIALKLPLIQYLLVTTLVICLGFNKSSGQCSVYDGQGNVSANPVWVSCSGGAFTLYVQSPNNFTQLTIDWGDGTPDTTIAALISPAFVSHTYAATIANYTVTISDTNGCVITGLVVLEEPVNASIQIPVGGVTQTCAPDVLVFTNSSTDVSSNTTFVWDFGDGSPLETYGDTNQGQTVSHEYLQGTVDCVTEVTLEAENYCSFGNPTVASFNPIQIYDIDEAEITADYQLLCYPDTVVHFDNTTQKNCVPQGNTAQRFEYWNFGDYWGLGNDSIIDWTPFDPPAKPGYDIAFPGVGTYIIMMADSNQCGADTAYITIQITDQPIADFSINVDSTCQGEVVTFTRLSTGGNAHLINYGDGGGFQAFGATNNHVYNTAGLYSVTVVANVGGGSPSCTDTMTLPIQILPSPTANANINPNGGCDSVTSVFINTSSGGATYFWNFGNGTNSTLQNPPPVSYTTTGLHTVTLTVTSGNGCLDSTTADVEVYDTPVASFDAQNVCEDALATFYDSSSVGYGGPINSWSWSFGDSLNSTSTLQNPNFTFIDSGTYTIQLVASTSYCSDTIVNSLVVEPRPIAQFQESDSIGCSPLNVSFTNQSTFASSYLWDFGDGTTSTQVSPTYTFTNNGLTDTVFIVKLFAESAFGCVDSIFDTIVVLGNPIADFTSNAILDCAPLQVQFSDSSVNAISWNWDFDDGFGSTQQNPMHVFENQTQFITSYNVVLEVTSANGCIDSAEQSVTVYPEPLFGFSIVPDSGCSPLSVQFPVAVGAVLYNWDFGDNTTSTGANPTHTYVNNTTNAQEYEVTLVATSAFGCIDTVIGTVTVFPKPNAVLTPASSSGCGPLNVTFTNASTGGTTYDWDFDDGTQLTSNSATQSHDFGNNPNDTSFYYPTLIATTLDGCKDTAQVEVQVYKEIQAAFTVPTEGCGPINLTFSDQSINATTWNWDFDDGSFSTLSNPQHLFVNTTSSPIVRDVSLEVESLEGCIDDTTVQVTVNPKPAANFSLNNSPACNDQIVTIENLSSGQVQSTWRFFNSGLPTIINSTQFDTTFSNPGTQPLEFRIYLVVQNSFGCTDSIDKQMTIYPEVDAEFIGFDEGCSPFEVEFTNQSTGGNLHAWSFGNGDISFEDEPTYTFENTGIEADSFMVVLTTTSPYGCDDSDSMEVIVHPTPNPLFTANPVSQRYPDTVVNFSNLTNPGPWIYEWSFGDGEGALTQNPVTHSYSEWGEYVIVLKAFSDKCEDTISQRVVILPPLPIADFDTIVDDCAPITIQFDNRSLYGTSYLWEFGDGATSTSENPQYTYQFSGVYSVKLTVTGPGGDVDQKEIANAITVRDQPIANFIYSPSEVSVPNPVVFINYSQFADSYYWEFGDSTTSIESNPQKVYITGGQFYPMLVASTEFGCLDTFINEIPITVLQTGYIEIPNAFTPNTNGSGGGYYDPLAADNQVFFPVLTGVLGEDYTLSIFNRWGELLFETHEIGRGWDGYYRGKLCVQDAYVWKIKGTYANGKKFSKVGDVTLIR